MQTNWLVDASVHHQYYQTLENAIRKNGDRVVKISRPDPPYGWDDVDCSYRDLFRKGEPVITLADIDLVVRIYEDDLWNPGVFASIENYFCTNYYPMLGRLLLNHDCAQVSFGQLPDHAESLFDSFGWNDQIFVRPDSPLKLFTGLTVSHSTFQKDYDFMGFHEFPIESIVLVSSPKEIVKEWRFVVVEGEVVTGSLYKVGDKLVISNEFSTKELKFAQSVADTGYTPDPVWILDICETKDNQLHVLETGGFSFSALYQCNLNRLVPAVSRVVQQRSGDD